MEMKLHTRCEPQHWRDANFVIGDKKGYTFDEAVRVWKGMYGDDKEQWAKDVCTHPVMDEFKETVLAMWDSIEPIK